MILEQSNNELIPADVVLVYWMMKQLISMSGLYTCKNKF